MDDGCFPLFEHVVPLSYFPLFLTASNKDLLQFTYSKSVCMVWGCVADRPQ